MERRAKVELFEQIRREYEFGVGSIKGVARKLGVHRRMVRQALADAQPQERKASKRARPVMRPLITFIDPILGADRTTSGGGSKDSFAAREDTSACGERSACDSTTAFAPTAGKPYEGELHVRFDEGAVETGRRPARPGHSPERGETAGGRRAARGTAPVLYSTRVKLSLVMLLRVKKGPSNVNWTTSNSDTDASLQTTVPTSRLHCLISRKEGSEKVLDLIGGAERDRTVNLLNAIQHLLAVR